MGAAIISTLGQYVFHRTSLYTVAATVPSSWLIIAAARPEVNPRKRLII